MRMMMMTMVMMFFCGRRLATKLAADCLESHPNLWRICSKCSFSSNVLLATDVADHLDSPPFLFLLVPVELGVGLEIFADGIEILAQSMNSFEDTHDACPLLESWREAGWGILERLECLMSARGAAGSIAFHPCHAWRVNVT